MALHIPYGHHMYRPYLLYNSYLVAARPCVRKLSLFGVHDRVQALWFIALRCTEWPMMKEINANGFTVPHAAKALIIIYLFVCGLVSHTFRRRRRTWNEYV